MKKIALITFHHPESTLPLVKYLAKKGNTVDYYYIAAYRFKCDAAFDFGGKVDRLGIMDLSKKRIPDMYNYMESDRVKIHIIGLLPGNLEYFGYYFRNVLFIFQINKIILKLAGKKIRKKNYDTINIVGQEKLLKTLHKSIKHKNKFHTFHEISDHLTGDIKHKELLNYIFKNKIKIIVHSQNTFDRISSLNNSNNNTISVIPFGLFETYKLFDKGLKMFDDIENILLFYGFMKPYKGLNVLIEAVEILKKRTNNFKVVIAGSGTIANKDLLEKDDSYIIINRYITNEEIVALNKAAKIIVCPYLSVSQSGLIPTSFVFEKPIIASNIGAFKETLIDGYNGLFVDTGSPEDLAEKIFKLLNDETLYLRLSENIKNFGKSEEYGWVSIANKTFNTYFDSH